MLPKLCHWPAKRRGERALTGVGLIPTLLLINCMNGVKSLDLFEVHIPCPKCRENYSDLIGLL